MIGRQTQFGLRRAWRKWDSTHGSENDPVDGLSSDQLFIVMAMADGGRDLEASIVASFEQAKGILMQVCLNTNDPNP